MQFFALIQLLLKIFGLWEQFQNWYDEKKTADKQKQNQERNKAVDEQKKAENEEEFDKNQDTIVRTLPKP